MKEKQILQQDGKGEGKLKENKNNKEKQAKQAKQPWKSFLWQLQEGELPLYSEQPDYMMEPVQKVEYRYDAVGNWVEMKADDQVTSYAYDEANRMTSAGEDSFLYDENGNLIEKSNEKGALKYSYSGDNKLQGVYYPDGTNVEYRYDALRQKTARTAKLL